MIKVGQVLFIVEKTYRDSDVARKYEAAVTRVGKKYFYIKEGHWEYKYDLSTLQEVNDSNYHNKAYLSAKDYEDEKEASNLRREISNFFRYAFNCEMLPLVALRQIQQIIKENTK